jgi:hypothetical protein
MLYDPEAIRSAKENVGRVRQEFTWDKALAPLVEFCRNPLPAPDRVPPEQPVVRHASPTRVLRERVREDIVIAKRHLRDGGIGGMFSAAGGRVQRKFAARKRKAARA